MPYTTDTVSLDSGVPGMEMGRPNRLFGMRGYLCGAMDRADDGGEGWRINLQRNLRDLCVFWFDPSHKPIDIGVEDVHMREEVNAMKARGEFAEAAAAMKPVRCVDLRMVDITDFTVVNIDLETHACGTYEEITLANRQKKPVIVHMEQGKEHTPNWLLTMLPHQMIFSTWGEVEGYLRHVATAEVVRHYHRWYFFNFGMCRKFDAAGNLVN
jgi:nucleoside 2-deoxyribosyltransferase